MNFLFRQRLAQEDPGYDPVAAFSQFAFASGDEFVDSMSGLLDFLNILPTLTRTFSNRYGLPSWLQLRSFHHDDANRYFLYLRDSHLRPLRNVFSGAKYIGTAPIYTNEKVVWKLMRYPGPWIVDPARPAQDRAHATFFIEMTRIASRPRIVDDSAAGRAENHVIVEVHADA